jgi:transposase
VKKATHVGCWSHARRKFDEAIKASGGKGKKPKALEGLEYCNKIFSLEREFKDLEPAERLKKRQKKSKPVLDAFLSWLRDVEYASMPKTHLGEAVNYCLNQWKPLTAFLLDGRLEIDNNRSERSIKPFVIARKNSMFCNTPKGARASAIVFSIIESAKENGLKPAAYLEYLLTELPNATTSQLEGFLPWSSRIPDYCRMKR